MAFVKIAEGTEIFYEESNPSGGNVLLCCHGSGGRSNHWRFQRSLTGNIRIIAIDLPGHGNSGGNAMDNVAAYREVIKSVAEGLGLKKFFLCGHSLGSAITLDYARCYPDDLKGMILISGGARLKVMPAILETFKNKNIFPEMPVFAYGTNAEPSLIEEGRKELNETPPEVFFADFSACNNFDIMDELKSIKVPALVLAGTEDMLTPFKYSRYLEDNLPSAEMAVIQDAGHMLMLQCPDEVNKYIADFVC